MRTKKEKGLDRDYCWTVHYINSLKFGEKEI